MALEGNLGGTCTIRRGDCNGIDMDDFVFVLEVAVVLVVVVFVFVVAVVSNSSPRLPLMSLLFDPAEDDDCIDIVCSGTRTAQSNGSSSKLLDRGSMGDTMIDFGEGFTAVPFAVIVSDVDVDVDGLLVGGGDANETGLLSLSFIG